MDLNNIWSWKMGANIDTCPKSLPAPRQPTPLLPSSLSWRFPFLPAVTLCFVSPVEMRTEAFAPAPRSLSLAWRTD